MNIFNRIAGALIGIVTGVLTAALQIPYGYYVFARGMKEAGYSPVTTFLATATLGTVGVAMSSIMIVLCSPLTILMGMRKGWNGGIKGAIAFPNTFRVISNSLRGSLPLLRVGGIFRPGETALKITSELYNLSKAGADHYNYSYHLVDLKHQADKVAVVNKIRALPTENIDPELLLTKAEIDAFSEIVQAQIEEARKNKEILADPNYKKNTLLSAYLTSCCPLTLAQLYEEDLHSTFSPNIQEQEIISNNRIPITVECLDNFGGKTIVTYNYDSFERWLLTDLDDIKKFDLILPDRRRSLINEDKQINVYRGYSKDLDVDYIRQVIHEWEKKAAEVTIDDTEVKAKAAKVTTSVSNSSHDDAEEKAVTARTREGFLAGLEKRNKKPETLSDTQTPLKPSNTPQRQQ